MSIFIGGQHELLPLGMLLTLAMAALGIVLQYAL